MIPQGKNSYCGPAVIAGILGISPDEAADQIRALRLGGGPIKGVYLNEIEKVLRRNGKTVQDLGVPWPRPTLAKWLETTERSADEFYVVFVTGHFVLIDKNRFYDSRNRNGVTIWDRRANRRSRVIGALRVLKA